MLLYIFYVDIKIEHTLTNNIGRIWRVFYTKILFPRGQTCSFVSKCAVGVDWSCSCVVHTSDTRARWHSAIGSASANGLFWAPALAKGSAVRERVGVRSRKSALSDANQRSKSALRAVRVVFQRLNASHPPTDSHSTVKGLKREISNTFSYTHTYVYMPKAPARSHLLARMHKAQTTSRQLRKFYIHRLHHHHIRVQYRKTISPLSSTEQSLSIFGSWF